MATTVSRGKWVMARHHAYVDDALWKLIHRKIPQRILLVREPPRHGKSEHLSHWTPAWYLANFPDREVMVTGYGQRFAQKWGRRSRNTFAMVAALFGTALAADRQAADNWGTVDGGGCITAGLGGGISGEGGSLLLVDDLIKNSADAQSEAYREEAWDWFRSTLWTRLAPDGVCIAIGTSWHRDDYQQRMKSEFGDEVLDICLPAIAGEDDLLGRQPDEALWEDRWSREWLESQRKILGPYFFAALYQQRPALHEHAEWPAEYFGDHIWTDGWPQHFELSAVWIDPSKGKDQKRGDYSAVVFAGLASGSIWVDSWIERRPVNIMVESTIERCREWQPQLVGIESNTFQELIAPEFDRQCQDRRIPPLPIHTEENTVKKEVRISRIGQYLARNQLKFRKTRHCKLLVEQMKDFPLGDHDDGPDALEGAIRMLNKVAAGPSHDYIEDFATA